jgi:SAM-dependent methyltransferase
MREICGDKKLCAREKACYLAYNFLRGLRGSISKHRMRTYFWSAKRLAQGRFYPGRRYFTSFLYEYIPGALRKKEIRVLDIGCGDAALCALLSQRGYRGSYHGLDIYKDKDFQKNTQGNFSARHILSRIEDFQSNERYDAIFSIAVLEHLVDARAVIEKCSGLCAEGCLQLHVVPARAGLFLHLWHGFRQYNPHLLEELLSVAAISDFSTKVYRVGGAASFFLHFFFITVPFVIFKKNIFFDLPSFFYDTLRQPP